MLQENVVFKCGKETILEHQRKNESTDVIVPEGIKSKQVGR